jgi:hypothetical protein
MVLTIVARFMDVMVAQRWSARAVLVSLLREHDFRAILTHAQLAVFMDQ